MLLLLLLLLLQYRVDMTRKQIRAFILGSSHQVAHPIHIKPMGPAMYYQVLASHGLDCCWFKWVTCLVWSQKHEGFSVWWILGNPMLLLMGFSMLMMLAMPKMMENMGANSLKHTKYAHTFTHTHTQIRTFIHKVSRSHIFFNPPPLFFL